MVLYWTIASVGLLFIWCVKGYGISESSSMQCICAGDKDVIIHKHPNLGPVLVGTLKGKSCYQIHRDDITETTVDGVRWIGVRVGSERGYLPRNTIDITDCVYTDTKPFVFQDSTNEESLDYIGNGVPGPKQIRAVPIGDTAACGQNLLQWVNQAPDRVLAQHGKSCYGMQTGLKQTFQYAFTYCQSSISYLVDILDDEEQAFVEMLINRNMPGERTWIGLNDVQTERTFDWTSGKPTTYVNWYSTSQAYSSSAHDTEDCVTLVPFHGGKWEVEKCYTGNDRTEPRHVFICEFEIKTPSQIVG